MTSPSQRANHRANAAQILNTPNNRKSSIKTSTPIESSTNVSNKIKSKIQVSTNRPQQQQQQKSVILVSDDDDDANGNSEDEGDDSGSESSYFSPSESENDRDSDLDFSVNDRPSRVRKVNRSRSIKGKQQNKSNTKMITKKRQSASVDGGNFQGDESPTTSSPGSKKKLPKTPRRPIRNSLSVTTPQTNVPQIKTKPISTTITTTSLPKITNNQIIPVAGKQPVIMTNTPKNTLSTGTQNKLILTKVIQKPKMSDTLTTTIKPDLSKTLLAPIQSITAGPQMPALAPISDITHKTAVSTPTTTIIIPKKDKKPPAHVEALFSDMTSLFSSPDIIKKVGSSSSGSPSCISVVTIPPTTLKPIPIGPQKTLHTVPTIPGTASTKCYFMPLTPGPSKNRLPAQISIQTHTSSNTIPTITSNLGSEQDKQLDLIDSIVQQELKQTTIPPAASSSKSAMNVETSNIAKMLEHNARGIISNVINLNTPSVNTMSSTTNNSVPFTGAITNDTPLLDDDSDLLESLTNPDDGLTEDLLQHVAKLVEDKNLQEVIDKQVLGVTKAVAKTTPSSTTGVSKVMAPMFQQQKQKINRSQPKVTVISTATLPVTSAPTTLSSIPTTTIIDSLPAQIVAAATPQTIPATPPTSRPLVSPSAGKEPIKIVRSDGRVITLPPIEAPTTRGAKRRAQNQPAGNSPVVSSGTSTPDIKTPTVSKEVVSTPSTSRAKEIIKERRVSTAAKKNTDQSATKAKLQTQPQQSAANQISALPKPIGLPDDDEEDDDDSDGSYNSEDDPYRYGLFYF